MNLGWALLIVAFCFAFYKLPKLRKVMGWSLAVVLGLAVLIGGPWLWREHQKSEKRKAEYR